MLLVWNSTQTMKLVFGHRSLFHRFDRCILRLRSHRGRRTFLYSYYSTLEQMLGSPNNNTGVVDTLLEVVCNTEIRRLSSSTPFRPALLGNLISYCRVVWYERTNTMRKNCVWLTDRSHQKCTKLETTCRFSASKKLGFDSVVVHSAPCWKKTLRMATVKSNVYKTESALSFK